MRHADHISDLAQLVTDVLNDLDDQVADASEAQPVTNDLSATSDDFCAEIVVKNNVDRDDHTNFVSDDDYVSPLARGRVLNFWPVTG